MREQFTTDFDIGYDNLLSLNPKSIKAIYTTREKSGLFSYEHFVVLVIENRETEIKINVHPDRVKELYNLINESRKASNGIFN